jgi:hypothetical protein
MRSTNHSYSMRDPRWRKWQGSKDGAKARGIEFHLTFTDYCQLMNEAGIEANQIGKHMDDYQLARYHDQGPYQIGNCRFITMRENQAEQDKSSPIMKQKLRDGWEHCERKKGWSPIQRERIMSLWTPERRLEESLKQQSLNTPEVKIKKSIAMQELWQDPDFRKKAIQRT